MCMVSVGCVVNACDYPVVSNGCLVVADSCLLVLGID